MENGDGPRVSIYISTRRSGPETREDPIRFKNQVARPEELLVESGVRPAGAGELLDAARRLIDNHEFWQRCSGTDERIRGLEAASRRENSTHFHKPLLKNQDALPNDLASRRAEPWV